MINDLVDDPGLEDLVRLVREQVHQVVHVVDGLRVLHVLAAPLRQQLLAESEDEVPEVGIAGELTTLPWSLDAHLNLVAHWSEERQHEGLPLPDRSRHGALKFDLLKFIILVLINTT